MSQEWFNAVKNNNIEKVKRLIGQGADVNVKDGDKRTALHEAAEKRYTDIVTVLLEKPEMQVNAKDKLGYTALHLSAEKGHEKIVDALLTLTMD